MNAYLHDADEVGRSAPALQQWFRELYASGLDTPIERSVDLVLMLASGRADALSGCYLEVGDDVDALIAQAAQIQLEDRLRLRLYR